MYIKLIEFQKYQIFIVASNKTTEKVKFDIVFKCRQ